MSRLLPGIGSDTDTPASKRASCLFFHIMRKCLKYILAVRKDGGGGSSLEPRCWWEGSQVKWRLLGKTVNKRNPGHSSAAAPLLSRPGARNGKSLSLSLSLFPATSCIVIVEVFHAPVGADKSRGRSPQAFPAMIATPSASGLIKGPIRALNGRPLRGHPH